MDDYYERLNQAFANWNGGGEPSLEQRVENLEAEIIQKQDILTFDTEPVEDSENPVTSGGLFSQFERYATKTALDEKVDTSIFTADQERQDALEAEDRTALIQQVDSGAKNLLKNTAQTQTVGGVTFTVNSDGSITANGTAENTVEFDLKIPAAFSGKNYFVSGCPTGGATAYTYRQLIRDVTNQKNLGSDTGDGVGVTFPNPVENVVLRINIFSGYTANNLTFKPMICTSADYAISHAFVPYRPSWQEMWDMIQALQSGS